MIYPVNNIVTYLDIETGDQGKVSIGDLLTKYFHETTNLGSTYDKISDGITIKWFYRENVLIKDWDGWSKLRTIEYRRVKTFDEFFSLKYGDEFIVLNNQTMIPTYSEDSIDHPQIGFHGEQKYHEVLKPIGAITENDYIRFYNKDLCTKNRKFIKPIIEYYQEIYLDVIVYNVVTESKYFNLGNFYLF